MYKISNLVSIITGLSLFFLYCFFLHPLTGFIGGIPLFLLGFTIIPNLSLVLISYGLTPSVDKKMLKITIFIIIYLFTGWLLVADNLSRFDADKKIVVINDWDIANHIFYNGGVYKESEKLNPYYQQVGFFASGSDGIAYWFKNTKTSERLENNFLSNSYEMFTHATIPSYIYLTLSRKIY